MSAIGGYFEIELNKLSDGLHPSAICLNSARNAFEYVILLEKYTKIYIPYFTCDVILEPLKKLNVVYEFYHIDQRFEPLFDFTKIQENEGFLYTNYFGVKDFFINHLSVICQNLIIDNAQAFFANPINKIATFYSPRKFFGVSDGAYLFTNNKLSSTFEMDESYKRMSHLLKRADINAEAGYSDFITNDKNIEGQPIQIMSKLTSKILSSIDYEKIKKVRIANFNYLHSNLKDKNKIEFDDLRHAVPMVYPYWGDSTDLRVQLINNKIYTAIYWPNVKEWCKVDSLEYQLTDEVVYLPIDQRYGYENMNTILQIILK